MSETLASDAELAIRRMEDVHADYARMRDWLNTPHVREWWDPDLPPHTIEKVVDEYRQCTTGESSTVACFITVDGVDTGFVQFYPWADDSDFQDQVGMALPADAWGLDVFIGETRYLRRGYGRRAVALVCAHLVAAHGAAEVDLVTATANARAQATYVAAGFARVAEYLDTDTKNGERMLSWLMRWVPPNTGG